MPSDIERYMRKKLICLLYCFLAFAPVRSQFQLVAADDAPFLSAPTRSNSNTFAFTLNGDFGQSYTVLATTNLTDSSWLMIGVATNFGNPILVLDNQATNSIRFYRVSALNQPVQQSSAYAENSTLGSLYGLRLAGDSNCASCIGLTLSGSNN